METFPSKNIAITWVEKGSLARNLFLSLGFAIVTALSAQIRIELPITPVPITAQTFVSATCIIYRKLEIRMLTVDLPCRVNICFNQTRMHRPHTKIYIDKGK